MAKAGEVDSEAVGCGGGGHGKVGERISRDLPQQEPPN